MGKDLFEKRKLEFIEFIQREKRMPKIWEFHFSDGEDMRLWFDKLPNFNKFQVFKEEINKILDEYGKKTLNDKEREEEFLNYVSKVKHIPMRGEMYFTDSVDMNTWYLNYKNKHQDFETIVYTNLPEYTELNLAEIWTPELRKEFINVLMTIKRIPDHGKVKLQNDIDFRVLYEKLKSYDKSFSEEIQLHLQTYNKKRLSEEERIEQLKKVVSHLGYIPDLQEARFTDGTDMLTWYTRYKNEMPNLEQEINCLVNLVNKETPKKKVNIYLIPNFRKAGGKFYTICTNVGERLDLSNITSYEQAKELDDTFTKRGGLILRKDEEIDSVSFGKGKSK